MNFGKEKAYDKQQDRFRIGHLAVHLTLVGALREGEVAGLTPEDLDFEGADGTGTFRINKCMQRVQKASLAKTGKECILQEFEDKREGSTTTLVLKKTKTACSAKNSQSLSTSSERTKPCPTTL